MPSPTPDIKLRRMIADLAALHMDDIADVLTELDPEQRQVVTDLLREYAPPLGLEVEAPVRADCDVSRLSAWLVRRWGPPSSKDDFRMTPQARKALHECAMKLYPAQSGRGSPGGVPA